jgi:hypothetical protein
VFVGSTVAEDPAGGESHRLDDLAFDRAQYAAEVERATVGRSWLMPSDPGPGAEPRR